MRKPKDIKIGDYTLEEILEKHLHWLNMDCKNWESMRANMYGADLHSANMIDADMRGADLRGANLRGANLYGTNMYGANLRGANMIDANMRDANLCGADKLRKGIKLSEPIIGWKKCKNNVLVKLEIPRGAIVFSINNSKCRTDKAKVLEIIGGNRAYSNHKFFSYYVGDIIEIFDFNCEYNIECAEGIHFFKTREEAENY